MIHHSLLDSSICATLPPCFYHHCEESGFGDWPIGTSYHITLSLHITHITSQGQNEIFAEGSNDALLFCIALTKITTVLGPIAKAIQCLELAHTTCADAYLVFLTIVAQQDQIFSKNSIKLSQESIEGVREIINKCFDEIINKSHNDPYVPSFFLDPCQ